MMLRSAWILGTLLPAIYGGLATAPIVAQESVEKRFDELDRDADGRVTLEELPAAGIFHRLDLDRDGAILKPEAIEAVRRGVLRDVYGRARGTAQGPSTAASTEAPVREGPRTVRPGDLGVGRRVGDITITDLAGETRSLTTMGDGRVVVFAMTSTTCPLSRRYLPRLVELATASNPDTVWVLVNPLATDRAADMRAAANAVAERAIYVHDPEGRLASAIGATTTTDVVVIDADRTIVYHGAIDDQYGLGYSLDAPRRRYLSDALAAIESGDRPLIAATAAPGCVLDLSETDDRLKTDVTYHGRISRIIDRHCVDCHRDGGVGPFALDSYDDLVAHAAMVRDVIERGVMPPWFAAASPVDPESGRVHTPWANDRSLAESEVTDLLDWIAGGKPEGDGREAATTRRFEGEWQIGRPDAVFAFSSPVRVKATGTMPYQNVVIETHLPEDRWVQAIEIQPGDRSVVHHVLVFVLEDGADAAEEEDATAERGGFWGAYVPGNSTVTYPRGFAKRLPAGARLKFQMHYTPNGTATTDLTRIGLVWADVAPSHEVRVAGIVNTRISIPPGAADHREEASLRLPFDATIMGYLPHMHVRGKACRYELVRAGGDPTTLLDIPRYDFNWQLLYRYAEPLPLEAGDTLRFTAWFDNSAANPANPDPTKTVRWGSQTFDEMHLGYVEYFVPHVRPGSPFSFGAGRRGRERAGRSVESDARP